MTGDELTVSILREIRDELRTTRTDLGTELRAVREEFREGLSTLRHDLGSRIDENTRRMELVENTLLELAQQQRFVVRWLKGRSRHDRRVDDELVGIKGRLDVVERRLDER